VTFKVWQQFVQNPLKKHHTTFVKVVEGSEIYNFPIQHFGHFYSNFWSFKRSNRGTMTQFWASRRRAATSRAAPQHLGVRAPLAPSRGTASSLGHALTEAARSPRFPLADRSRHRVTVGPPWFSSLYARLPRYGRRTAAINAGNPSRRRLGAAPSYLGYKWRGCLARANTELAAVGHGSHRRGTHASGCLRCRPTPSEPSLAPI
jgi:hypothetical protein